MRERDQLSFLLSSQTILGVKFESIAKGVDTYTGLPGSMISQVHMRCLRYNQ